MVLLSSFDLFCGSFFKHFINNNSLSPFLIKVNFKNSLNNILFFFENFKGFFFFGDFNFLSSFEGESFFFGSSGFSGSNVFNCLLLLINLFSFSFIEDNSIFLFDSFPSNIFIFLLEFNNIFFSFVLSADK